MAPIPIRSPPFSAGTRSKTSTCRICNTKDTSQNEAKLVCCYCNRNHHLICAGVSTQFYECYVITKKMDWHCYMCEDNLNKKNMDSINTISSLLQTASTEIEKIKQQNSSWKQEFEVKVKETVQIEVMKATRNIRVPNNDNYSSRRKNLIISGIPKHDNMVAESVVRSLADLMGFEEQFWLDNCFKLPRKSSQDVMNFDNILIKFTTEMNRDGFMKSYFNYIKKKKLTPTSIGLSGENRIYINEQLSEDLSMIMKDAIA